MLNFLRNHDELNLSRLPAEERETLLGELGSERARIFGRGIRRRLPPLVDGDDRRMRSLCSAVLSLPGTPVVWYGEEIGMGHDVSLGGRMAVRTPTQWSSEADAGFSTARGDELIRPVVGDGRFAYENVNVAEQQRCDSLDDSAAAVHTFSAERVEVGLDRGAVPPGAHLAEVFADADYGTPHPPRPTFEIAGYGYRWFRAPRHDSAAVSA